ncbi:MAG: DUF2920 family protein [Limisphaerales bacterium]
MMIRFLFLVFSCIPVLAAEWPVFPGKDATVDIPAQEWPQQPGPRKVGVKIYFPGGTITGVKKDTGLMLSLHNWGGTWCGGSANPKSLAERLNVVAICVNYLQSGRKASVEDPEPYDCGYLQALDSLRALWFVYQGLSEQKISFARDRILTTGGSGGGNVSLMANKLAPRTFAAVIDMCGMPKLSDDIAFQLPGGSGLNARWSRDPASPYYLSPAEQEIRFIGHPGHLSQMKELGNRADIFVVHGRDDRTCPFPDAEEMVANFQSAGLNVKPHFIGNQDVDGKVFKSSGHSLGNRTEIAIRYGAGPFKRDYQSDFDLKDEKVRYAVTGGEFVISYRNGYPVGRFEQTKNHRVLRHAASKLEPDHKATYKTIGGRTLQLHIFNPENREKKRPVFMIIHGGGWTGGEPRKFYTIADYFARKGMVGISLQYRLMNRKLGTTVFDCVKDGRSAIRFLRKHADELGIDPDRIAVAGGSAGGHVAMGSALLNFDEAGDDIRISCVPNALIPLNPVIDTSKNGYGQTKIGERWRELSPLHQVKRGLPTTLIFHSTKDTVTPYAGAKRFHELSKAAGNDCELVTFEGGRHGYFIFDLAAYRGVMNRMKSFLEQTGFLPAAR